MGVSNVSNMSERLTLVELTQWCAKNTQPRYPIGLAFGTTCNVSLKPMLHIYMWLGYFKRLEHFTWQSNVSCHNLICSVFKERLQENYTIRTNVSLRKKAIHLPPTHWVTPFTFLEVGVLLPNYDRFSSSF